MSKKTSKHHPDLAALNIRNFPRELLKKCKMRALQQDQPLRDFVVEALRNKVAMPQSQPRQRSEPRQI